MTDWLRPYQADMVHKLRQHVANGGRAPCMVLPCGAGKTHVMAEIVHSALEKNRRVLSLATRRELVYQASDRFQDRGADNGIIMAGEPRDWLSQAQVASCDTLWARVKRGAPMPNAAVCLADEAHLYISPTRQKILNHYKDLGAVVIGVTATPARGDGRGLGEVFDGLIEGPPTQWFIEHGYLLPAQYWAPSKPDLEGVKTRSSDGDYVEKQLGEVMNQPKLVGDIIDNWFKIAHGLPTVVYCVNRAHARSVYDGFVARGVKSEYLDGETPLDERKGIFERMDSGESTVLVNVFVATYGLDIPRLQVAVLARPTRNITLYRQIGGRVLRPFQDQEHAIIIDHAGAVEEHGFLEDEIPWDLNPDSKVKERREKQQKEKKEPKDLTCPECKTVFRSSRTCPSCGFQMIPPGKPIPVHEADLVPVKGGKKANSWPWEQKQKWARMLKFYQKSKGYNDGWYAHKYKDKFGVWPNDARVKSPLPMQPDTEVMGWIRHTQIKYAKRLAKHGKSQRTAA